MLHLARHQGDTSGVYLLLGCGVWIQENIFSRNKSKGQKADSGQGSSIDAEKDFLQQKANEIK